MTALWQPTNVENPAFDEADGIMRLSQMEGGLEIMGILLITGPVGAVYLFFT